MQPHVEEKCACENRRTNTILIKPEIQQTVSAICQNLVQNFKKVETIFFYFITSSCPDWKMSQQSSEIQEK